MSPEVMKEIAAMLRAVGGSLIPHGGMDRVARINATRTMAKEAAEKGEAARSKSSRNAVRRQILERKEWEKKVVEKEKPGWEKSESRSGSGSKPPVVERVKGPVLPEYARTPRDIALGERLTKNLQGLRGLEAKKQVLLSEHLTPGGRKWVQVEDELLGLGEQMENPRDRAIHLQKRMEIQKRGVEKKVPERAIGKPRVVKPPSEPLVHQEPAAKAAMEEWKKAPEGGVKKHWLGVLLSGLDRESKEKGSGAAMVEEARQRLSSGHHETPEGAIHSQVAGLTPQNALKLAKSEGYKTGGGQPSLLLVNKETGEEARIRRLPDMDDVTWDLLKKSVVGGGNPSKVQHEVEKMAEQMQSLRTREERQEFVKGRVRDILENTHRSLDPKRVEGEKLEPVIEEEYQRTKRPLRPLVKRLRNKYVTPAKKRVELNMHANWEDELPAKSDLPEAVGKYDAWKMYDESLDLRGIGDPADNRLESRLAAARRAVSRSREEKGEWVEAGMSLSQKKGLIRELKEMDAHTAKKRAQAFRVMGKLNKRGMGKPDPVPEGTKRPKTRWDVAVGALSRSSSDAEDVYQFLMRFAPQLRNVELPAFREARWSRMDNLTGKNVKAAMKGGKESTQLAARSLQLMKLFQEHPAVASEYFRAMGAGRTKGGRGQQEFMERRVLAAVKPIVEKVQGPPPEFEIIPHRGKIEGRYPVRYYPRPVDLRKIAKGDAVRGGEREPPLPKAHPTSKYQGMPLFAAMAQEKAEKGRGSGVSDRRAAAYLDPRAVAKFMEVVEEMRKKAALDRDRQLKAAKRRGG